MLFCENLENIVFTRNQLFECDELIILSGYVGPMPIRKLENLPIKSTVIYGMYGCEGIRRGLHSALLEENKKLSKVNILYSSIPVHSKCYIWKNQGKVVHALVGSANFSVNGLTTPYKEVLAETSYDTFDPLNKYLELVLGGAIKCEDAEVKENKKKASAQETDLVVFDKDVCSMPLYIIEDGVKTVPPQSGINWGMAKLTGSHVNINDAYIRIGAELLEYYPKLFPKKQEAPKDDNVGKKGHRHNDNVEIIWDDGEQMKGLLEGSVSKEIDGHRGKYPKQISSTPNKSTLGKYIRKRMGIKEGKPITYEDLLAYGRTTVDVSLQGDGVYFFDFSVNQNV